MKYLNEQSTRSFLNLALAVVFIWFGALKFTTGGAEGIQGLVTNSPLLFWVYAIFGVQAFAAILGTVEIVIGLMLALGTKSARMAQLGGLGASITFLVTLSFMLSTPGVVPEGSSFPILSAMPGEFLLKDLVLLAVSLFIFVDGRKRCGQLYNNS